MSDKRALSALLVTLFLATPLLAGTASGTYTVNGKTVKLQYAYATPRPNPFDKKKTDTFILISDKEVPASAVTDEFELMRIVDDLKLNAISVQINDEKSVNSGMFYSPSFKKMTQFSSVGNQKLEATTWTKDRVAGKMWMDEDDFFDNVFKFNVTFDTNVMAKAPAVAETLKGTKLPADGGEPGKAYFAYRKIMAKGDFDGLRKVVAAERAKAMDDPEFKKMFPLIQSMQPKDVKITSGAIDGNNATLNVTGKDEGGTSTGTITLVREGGAWKLYKESWKSKSE